MSNRREFGIGTTKHEMGNRRTGGRRRHQPNAFFIDGLPPVRFVHLKFDITYCRILGGENVMGVHFRIEKHTLGLLMYIKHRASCPTLKIET